MASAMLKSNPTLFCRTIPPCAKPLQVYSAVFECSAFTSPHFFAGDTLRENVYGPGGSCTGWCRAYTFPSAHQASCWSRQRCSHRCIIHLLRGQNYDHDIAGWSIVTMGSLYVGIVPLCLTYHRYRFHYLPRLQLRLTQLYRLRARTCYH
jgi:hypothetical protein